MFHASPVITCTVSGFCHTNPSSYANVLGTHTSLASRALWILPRSDDQRSHDNRHGPLSDISQTSSNPSKRADMIFAIEKCACCIAATRSNTRRQPAFAVSSPIARLNRETLTTAARRAPASPRRFLFRLGNNSLRLNEAPTLAAK